VTLRKPPNNKLFDVNNNSRMSPVLQRRKADQENAAKAIAAPPVFNISLGNDFANILRPPAQLLAPAPAPAPVYTLPSVTLLPSSCLPGVDMPLSEFCQQHHLGDSILRRLTDNGYMQSQMLRFIQIDELKEMHFLLGEIASLKDAVEAWSVPSKL
jgi:hypothetical protein